MDKLEEHIRKNRGELDIYTPSSGIWRKIKLRLKKGNPPLRHWLSIAAMIIVIFGTAVVFIRKGSHDTGTGEETTSGVSQTQGGTRLEETEIYYKSLVNSLYRKASPLLTGNPEIEKELNTDITQLDSICAEIKKDLKDNVANQEVVEALIQNYTLKIRLLEDMLAILKEKDNNADKNKNYEL